MSRSRSRSSSSDSSVTGSSGSSTHSHGGSSSTSTSGSRSNSQSGSKSSDSDSELSTEDLERPLYPKYLNWFKQAIIKIKGQKQRPCKDRIFQAIRQYSQNDKDDKDPAVPACTDNFIRRQMELAVDGGHLFLVYCNGMESYKDTEYTRKLRKYHVKDDKSARKAVKLAVREIGDPKGTDETTILSYLKCTFTVDVAALESVVRNALTFITTKKELLCNNGIYTIAPTSTDGPGHRPKSSMSSSSMPRSDEKKKKKKKKQQQQAISREASAEPKMSVSRSPLPSTSTLPKSTPIKNKKESDEKSKSRSPHKCKSTPEEQVKRVKSTSGTKEKLTSDEKAKKLKSPSPEVPAVIVTSPRPVKEEAGGKKKSSAEKRPGMSKLDAQLSKAGSAPRIIPGLIDGINSPMSPVKKKTIREDERVRSPKMQKEKGKKEEPVKKKRGRPAKPRDASASEKPAKSKSPPHRARSPSPDSDFAVRVESFQEAIPKELRDGLSAFFTPSLKRKSRVAINSLLSNAVPSPGPSSNAAKPPKPPKPRKEKKRVTVTIVTTETDSEADTIRIPSSRSPSRRVKSEGTTETDDTTGTDRDRDGRSASQKRKAKRTGSMQLKGLQDGLSRYFTAPEGDRKRRPPPTYTPSRLSHKEMKSVEKKTEDEEEEKEESEWESDSGVSEKSPERSEGKAEVGSRDSSQNGLRVPDTIPKPFEELFRKARQRALETIPTVETEYEGPLPPHVQIGKWKIKTWFTSPFPEEYIRCECLYLCEFCLQYVKTVSVLKSHYAKCPWHRPPGTEIYRDTVGIQHKDEELIIYETDGNDWKEYCQNLCLLAKLYLDHKTLYYDVEPFLFYVLCRRDNFGDHLIGYFSKEKNSPQRYNVSCIMVLPPYQTSGYGRFLIDFSYLLSRVENQHGTPEKPLSELGQLSYQSYWRTAVLDFFVIQQQVSATRTSFKAICDATGMWPQDVADTLQQLNFLTKNDQTHVWEFRVIKEIIDDHSEKKAANKKRIPIFADKLHWDPWRGEPAVLTSTESERSTSLVKNGETADEHKEEDISHDTSDSEPEQALERTTSAAASTSRLPSLPRSRTPRGRPSLQRSISRDERRSSERPRVTARSSVSAEKPRRGRPPKNPPARSRRRSSAKEETVGTGTRKRRRGKIRKRTSSNANTTSSQPKNYKGRGEELRAGSDKHKHRKRDNGDESDISSFMNSPRRASSSTSLSSLDESLASWSDNEHHHPSLTSKHKPTIREHHTTQHHIHHHHPHSRRSLDVESITSERSSSSARSHLDQPPRAPHPQPSEPLDMMDAVTAADSPLDHLPETAITAQHPPLPPPPLPQPEQPRRCIADIALQTEPPELVSGVEIAQRAQPVDVPRAPPVEPAKTAMLLVNPLSPAVQASQPATPFPLGSPQMSLGSVGPAPGSVVSNHELQMAQDAEQCMMTQSSQAYENPRSYERHYAPHTPVAGAVPATPPAYQTYQQASPVATQVYQDVARPPTAQPYVDIHQPHTPATPQSAYMDPSPRPLTAFAENVHSPHQSRMQAQAPAYNVQEAYSTRSQSVAPGYVESGAGRRSVAHFTPEMPQQQEYLQYSKPTAPPTQANTQQKSRARQRPHVETPVAPPYPTHIATQQAAAAAQSTFFYGNPQMHPFINPFAAMQEQHAGHYGMQSPADSNNLAKLSRMTQGLPSGAMHDSHASMSGYGHVGVSGNQRSQSQSRQTTQQHVPPGMGMQMPASIPPGYNTYNMQNMKNLQQAYAGQSQVMAQGYPQAFFGAQAAPMASQTGQYRPANAHQGQQMYSPYYYPPGPQHPGHHASMRP